MTRKSDVREFQYKTKDGKGQMFSVDLIDQSRAETRCTFFGAAVDTFFNAIQQKQMYSFSGGRIKKGDSRYCPHEYEITFDEGASIAPAEDDAACPHMLYKFTSLDALPNMSPGSTVDIAAVIIEADECMDIPLKAGGTKPRRNVTLFDDSGVSCRLTIWGEKASLEWNQGSVMLAKSAKLSDFGGRSLNTSFASSIFLDQEAFRAHQRASALSEWYSSRGLHEQNAARSISTDQRASGPPQTVAEMQQEANLLESPVPEGSEQEIPGGHAAKALSSYHTIVPATITFIPHERAPFYKACPAEVSDEKAKGENKMRTCNRKVDICTDNKWRCASSHVCEAPCPRWMVSFAIADQSGSQFVSCFDETGQKMIGCSASDIAQLWDMKDTDAAAAMQLEHIFKSAQFKRWRLRLRSKKEVYNDEEKLKVSVVDCEQVSLAADGRKKLAEVQTALATLDMPGSALVGGAAATAGA